MTSPRTRNIDEVEKKLEEYKKKRDPIKNKSVLSPYEETLKALYTVVANPEFTGALITAAQSDDAVTALNELNLESMFAQNPELGTIIVNAKDLISTLIDEVKRSNPDLEKIVNDSQTIANNANTFADQAKQNFANLEYIKPIIEEVGKVGKFSLMLASAGRSYFKANDRLKLNVWLEQQLLKCSILRDEMAILKNIISKEKPQDDITYDDKFWEGIEERIKLIKPLKLKDKEINKLSPEAYHDKLFEVFSKFGTPDIEGKERELVRDLSFINENNINYILANLERRHIQKKLDKYESDLKIRLEANVKKFKDPNDPEFNKINKVLNTYLETQASDLRTFMRNLKANPINEENVTIVKEKEDEIYERLKEKNEKKKKDFIAKTMLFSAGVLFLGAAIAAPIPGGVAASVVLSVVGAGLTFGAFYIKRDVLKSASNDIWSFTDKLKNQYESWENQRAKKKELKKATAPTDEIIEFREIIEKVTEARKRNVAAEVQATASMTQQSSTASTASMTDNEFKNFKTSLISNLSYLSKKLESIMTSETNSMFTEHLKKNFPTYIACNDLIKRTGANIIASNDAEDLHKHLENFLIEIKPFQNAEALGENTKQKIENIVKIIKEKDVSLVERISKKTSI